MLLLVLVMQRVVWAVGGNYALMFCDTWKNNLLHIGLAISVPGPVLMEWKV